MTDLHRRKFAKKVTDADSAKSTWTLGISAIAAAIIAEGTPEIRTLAEGGDAEHRERVELRSKANLTNYLTAAAAGRLPSGAEAELAAAAGVGDGHIPLELWDAAEDTGRRSNRRARLARLGVNLGQHPARHFRQRHSPPSWRRNAKRVGIGNLRQRHY